MELDLENLKAIRVLGRGAMGTVFLVADRRSPASPPFALKVIDKASPNAKPDWARRARWELSLLSRLGTHHNQCFLPSLLGHAETPSLIAYAVPFCPGGDLNALRHSLSDRVFSPAAIRFYLSEILLALSRLHSLRIVYRDLKPENILLDSHGHVILTDFDLSRHLDPQKLSHVLSASSPPPPPPRHRRTLLGYLPTKAKSARVSSQPPPPPPPAAERSHSFVGTEEYVAPEVIRGEGHDFGVDFWALGILAHEMAYGRTPFKAKTRKDTFRNIVTKNLEFVGRHGSDLTDLIRRLLHKDPARRLGALAGAEEVKAHPFFDGVSWDLLADVSRPPHFPSADEIEEAAGTTAPLENQGFSIAEYFEKIRAPPAPTSDMTLPEF